MTPLRVGTFGVPGAVSGKRRWGRRPREGLWKVLLAVAAALGGLVAVLPGGKSPSPSPSPSPSAGGAAPGAGEPGALTTLLRLYIEERDRGALDAFFELVYDKYQKVLVGQIRRAGKASDVTVKEVIDASLARLLTDVMEEKYRKAPESAREHLKFMLKRRLIDRRRYWDRPHEDLVDYRASLADPQAKSPAALVELRDREKALEARLEEALSSLPEGQARLLRLRLGGRSHEEIARELGCSPVSIRKTYTRAVEQLMAKLIVTAPTLVHRWEELRGAGKAGAKPASSPEPETWPSESALREAVGGLTERVRRALEGLHFEGRSRKALEKDFGAEALGALLGRGYQILEARFKVSFPEAFERARS